MTEIRKQIEELSRIAERTRQYWTGEAADRFRSESRTKTERMLELLHESERECYEQSLDEAGAFQADIIS